MLRKLRRLSLFFLRLGLICLALSLVVFLLTSQTQLLAVERRGVSEADPFPWEAESEGEADMTEFRGPKRNLQTALVSEDVFSPHPPTTTHNVSTTLTTPHHTRSTQHTNHHHRSKYNYSAVQQTRQMELDSACREQTITRETWQDLSPSVQNTVAQRIIVNDEHKLLFCPVPLAAIGPWMKVMYLLGPGRHLKDIAEVPSKELTDRGHFAYLSSYSASEQEEKVSTYLKLMVARHPFLRIATAYKMKFEADNVFFHERYGKEIVRLYRSGGVEGEEEGNDVKFSEFVEYLLHLEKDDEKNEHWQPLHTLCRPCEVQYDYILHYETLETDASELLAEAGLLRRIPALPLDTWDDVPTQYVYSLFQQITPAWIGHLVHKYQEDFALFSYGSIF